MQVPSGHAGWRPQEHQGKNREAGGELVLAAEMWGRPPPAPHSRPPHTHTAAQRSAASAALQLYQTRTHEGLTSALRRRRVVCGPAGKHRRVVEVVRNDGLGRTRRQGRRRLVFLFVGKHSDKEQRVRQRMAPCECASGTPHANAARRAGRGTCDAHEPSKAWRRAKQIAGHQARCPLHPLRSWRRECGRHQHASALRGPSWCAPRLSRASATAVDQHCTARASRSPSTRTHAHIRIHTSRDALPTPNLGGPGT